MPVTVEELMPYVNNRYKLMLLVAQKEVDLPFFISNFTNSFGVEKLLTCLIEYSIEKKLLSLNSHMACGFDEFNSHMRF